MFRSKKFFLAAILLVGVVWLAFGPCLRAGFVNWDDTSHLTENAQVRFHSFENFVQIFKRSVNRTYIPLTIFSFQLEHAIFGMQPFVYHFNNLLLHSIVTLLVFLLALRFGLSLRAAVAGAILFGIHPMHVESVAWVTQRKDVLYACFYLLTLHTYWSYVKNKRRSGYLCALGLGFLSILAKPMALSLPWILLLIDWFAGRSLRDRRVWLEKVPFIFFIEPIAWLTYRQNSRVVEFTFPDSILTWLWTSTFYLKKFFWPHPLAIVYRLPEPVSFLHASYWTAAFVFGFIGFGCYRFRKNRLFMFALLFYCGSTFFLWRYDAYDPNIVADRFMYLPSLGLCLLLGYWGDRLLDKGSAPVRWQRLLPVAGGLIVVLFLFVKTYSQCLLWINGTRLWTAALALAPNNPFLLLTQGNSYAKKGEYDKALDIYGRLIILKPDFAEVYDKRGVIYDEVLGEPQPAIQEFDKAIQYDPLYAKAYYHKANTLSRLQQYESAMEYYDNALKIDSYLAEAYINRGHLNTQVHKNYDAALNDLNRAIELDPGFVESYVNRGVILGWVKGQYAQAIADLDRAIELEPLAVNAYLQRARIQKEFGRLDAALFDYDRIMHIDPNNVIVLEERAQVVLEIKNRAD